LVQDERVRLPRRALPAAYAGLAALDTALAGSSSPDVRRWRLVTKPLLMPVLGSAFAGSLARRERHHGGLLRGGTVAAQALSGVGDVALLGKSETAFLAGVGGFFGAHVAYTTGFASAGQPRAEGSYGGVVGAASAFAALAPVMGWAAGRRSPKLRGPVVAYAGALITMFAASTRLNPELPQRARQRIVAGTALFLTSDTILGVRQFVLDEPPAWLDPLVMATYTAGQGLIAAGVVEAVASGS
jgi:uncharacterized membrane protein YhhN